MVCGIIIGFLFSVMYGIIVCGSNLYCGFVLVGIVLGVFVILFLGSVLLIIVSVGGFVLFYFFVGVMVMGVLVCVLVFFCLEMDGLLCVVKLCELVLC